MENTTAMDDTSVVVAMPPTMPMIRMMGTSSAGMARTLIFIFSGQDRAGQRGQLFFLARRLIKIIRHRPSTAAGNTPATKNVATDKVVMEASTIITRLGATRVSEPEVKFIFLVLFFLGGLASTAKSEAVLPAYLVGLVVAGVFLRDKTLVHRMRSIAFTIFTPFYFIKAGSFVSLPAMWSALGIIMLFLTLKMVTKYIGVWPFTKMFYMRNREANYTTLLMATGLTFGTISALFGLQNHIIDQTQYTVLVTVVILSAFVPTLIAQKFFQPEIETMVQWGNIYAEKINNKKPRPLAQTEK